MVAIVAHDLQSPLAGIRALLRTFASGSDSEAAKLNEISRTCAEMQNAIGRLLAAHAAETSHSTAVVIDLEQLFARLATSAAPAAADKKIAVVCDANKRRTRSDPVALETALSNLLSNAIKFSPAGSVVRMNAQSYREGVRIRAIAGYAPNPEGGSVFFLDLPGDC
jgi:signal transduction histidine kinase